MKRKINLEVLFQLVIIFGCAIFLASALIGGNIKQYVHPRLTVFLWIASAVLIIIGIFLLPNLFKPKHSVHLMPYVILMIPMLTAFTLPANAVNNQSVSFENKTVQNIAPESPEPPDKAKPIEQQTEPAQTAVTTAPETEVTTTVNQDDSTASNMQIITDDGYVQWYTDCYDHPEEYSGKTVQFKAKIFTFEGAAENEFIPGRLCMLCCAADAAPWGFLCRSDDIKNFSENDWITVTAEIKIEDYNGKSMSILYADSIQPATPPQDEYIYFIY